MDQSLSQTHGSFDFLQFLPRVTSGNLVMWETLPNSADLRVDMRASFLFLCALNTLYLPVNDCS